MKKILFAILFLISYTVFPQSSTSSINTRITDSITTNNGRQITGAILNRLLKDMNGSYVNKTTDAYVKGATTPLSVTSNTVSISKATTSANGYLDSTDWDTFNNKGVGSVTTVTVSTNAGVSGVVTNPTSTPSIAITLGDITPSSVVTPSLTANIGTFTTVTTSTVTVHNGLGYYSNSALTHGMTRLFPTNVYGAIEEVNTDGGLLINGLSDSARTSGLALRGIVGGGTASTPAVRMAGYLKSGDTVTSVHDTSALFMLTNANVSTKMAMLGSGSTGFGTQSPAVSSLLDLTSTTKGFLPPRMTTVQRDAIVSPTNGLVIYNTTTGLFNGYQGGAWSAIGTNFFTQGSAYTYLTSTTDLFQVGSSSSLGASLGVKGQGATSGTTNLKGTNSSGSVLYEIKDNGQFSIGLSATAGDELAVAIGTRANAVRSSTTVGADAGLAMVIPAYNNCLFGYQCGKVLNSATACSLYGAESGIGLTTGINNSFFGYRCALAISTGQYNAIFGSRAAQSAGSASSFNSYFGEACGLAITGDNNTMAGFASGLNTATTSNAVYLGYYSGAYETGSGKLFIDGLNRTNEATARTNSMIYGVFNATVTSQTLALNAKVAINGKFLIQQGTDVASVAGAMTLPLDGNVFEVTGTNAITLISNVGWQNGAEVTLVFTSTATLTNGTATSGTDIIIKLAGAANFVASADDSITLTLCEIGGVQAWREKCRSVN